MDVKNRKTQKIILAISFATILLGLYDFVFNGAEDLFAVHYGSDNSQGLRSAPFIVMFLLALVAAFFSVKNLLKKD